jgi:hypothetical protein
MNARFGIAFGAWGANVAGANIAVSTALLRAVVAVCVV